MAGSPQLPQHLSAGDLTQPAPEPVPRDDPVAELRDDPAHSRPPAGTFEDMEVQRRCPHALAAPQDLPDLPGPANARRPGQPLPSGLGAALPGASPLSVPAGLRPRTAGDHRHLLAGVLRAGADRERRPAPPTAPVQGRAPGPGLHSRPETVLVEPLAVPRPVRGFHRSNAFFGMAPARLPPCVRKTCPPAAVERPALEAIGTGVTRSTAWQCAAGPVPCFGVPRAPASRPRRRSCSRALPCLT